jgi:hypothetical protein
LVHYVAINIVVFCGVLDCRGGRYEEFCFLACNAKHSVSEHHAIYFTLLSSWLLIFYREDGSDMFFRNVTPDFQRTTWRYGALQLFCSLCSFYREEL